MFRFLLIVFLFLFSSSIFSVELSPCRAVSVVDNSDCLEPLLPDVDKLRNDVCSVSGLQEAMAGGRMAEVIAGSNVFQTLASNDVVRMRRSVGGIMFFNPLKSKIMSTYKNFNENVQDSYTLHFTVYPAHVKSDTCQEHRTITPQPVEDVYSGASSAMGFSGDTLGVSREVDQIFNSYVVDEGRKPRHFSFRKDQSGYLVVCEHEQVPNREEFYCQGNEECQKQMPPLCSEFDQREGGVCASLDDIKDTTVDAVRKSQMALKGFCPSDCSYYVQVLQRVYPRGGGLKEMCAENYVIAHCGPKMRSLTYNLNIKVVNDFCEDFNVICAPEESSSQELASANFEN